jgi:hypothetical protein
MLKVYHKKMEIFSCHLWMLNWNFVIFDQVYFARYHVKNIVLLLFKTNSDNYLIGSHDKFSDNICSNFGRLRI